MPHPWTTLKRAITLCGALALSACVSPAPDAVVEGPLTPLPYHVGGRAVCVAGEAASQECTRQWPAGYFETAFTGERVVLSIGAGQASYKVSVDGATREYLRKPAAGVVAIGGLSHGAHIIRVDVISETQSEPSTFLGFFAPEGVEAASLPQRTRRIEFIGDSLTVGYANTSTTRECSDNDVWDTTDTSLSYGALLGARFNADYRINAISGRGVVRNYDGFIGDSLIQAYDYTLFNHDTREDDAAWRPDTIVIALGGNDFSTQLHEGERWADRDALRADYTRTYAAFLTRLRAAHPDALIVVWSLDQEGGEIESQVGPLVARLQSEGFQRLTYAPLRNLSMNACHWHPTAADDRAIADHIAAAIAAAGR
jgi:lysophospholipase L1-like esterase